MPDMPQQGGAQPSPPPGGAPSGQGAPPQGQDGAPSSGGGAMGDAIVQADGLLSKIAQVVSQSDKIPDDVKKGFASALTIFRSASQALVKAAGGGDDSAEDGKSEPDEDDQGGGPVSPQQGGSGGAVPMTHASMRG